MSRTKMFMEAALAIALDRTAVYGVAECACMHVELPYEGTMRCMAARGA